MVELIHAVATPRPNLYVFAGNFLLPNPGERFGF
jgi:hypothetical protein